MGRLGLGYLEHPVAVEKVSREIRGMLIGRELIGL